ncbi:aflatoxin biosynthesis ketoreductase-like protein nor-1 [Polychaeton citri CBS 116435]|uniref:Aflatoxin biosynthesis ketoreductase-like protein nor-1 n=1 Tax=Polychaeton citri CBS 116435 TaxID=1314669 RepID=A0A9P4UME7_9PEZI|nr:aflatoxin biosynthesis ketoreductase-like protein nor-1 [Polychaeton citri CBS 116435]
MPVNKTILVTGANRGLGLGFCDVLLRRPSHTVIAAIRDTTATAALKQIPLGEGSKLIVTKIDCARDEDPELSMRDLEENHGITHLDVVIGNAAIEKWFGPVATVPVDELRDHFEINSVSILTLFQATWPLLQKSTKPMFIPISTRLGSCTEVTKVKNPAAVYGASKAMVNYLTVRMHFENPELIAFPLSPGFVQTDMGNNGARKAGQEKAFLTIDQSITGMMKIVDSATREKTSGQFWSWDGTTFAW